MHAEMLGQPLLATAWQIAFDRAHLKNGKTSLPHPPRFRSVMASATASPSRRFGLPNPC